MLSSFFKISRGILLLQLLFAKFRFDRQKMLGKSCSSIIKQVFQQIACDVHAAEFQHENSLDLSEGLTNIFVGVMSNAHTVCLPRLICRLQMMRAILIKVTWVLFKHLTPYQANTSNDLATQTQFVTRKEIGLIKFLLK